MPPIEADLLADAIELAEHHWKVFPLRGKVPAIPRAHSRNILVPTSACIEGLVSYPNPLRDCKGECGQPGHGLYDAFVYSTNTPFEPTESGNPHGYTRFRAFGVLNHNRDLSAAARAIKKGAAQ
jgi:hypothetical protein